MWNSFRVQDLLRALPRVRREYSATLGFGVDPLQGYRLPRRLCNSGVTPVHLQSGSVFKSHNWRATSGVVDLRWPPILKLVEHPTSCAAALLFRIRPQYNLGNLSDSDSMRVAIRLLSRIRIGECLLITHHALPRRKCGIPRNSAAGVLVLSKTWH